MKAPVATLAPPVIRHFALFLLILGCYFLMPFGEGAIARSLVRLLVFAVGVVLVGALIVWHIRVLLREDGPVAPRIEGLLVAIYLAVIVFAAGYFVLARTDEGQFVGLATKVDALYFSLTTVTTTGFGDVYAAGQAARILVSVQIVFDVAVLGAAVAVMRAALPARRRRAD